MRSVTAALGGALSTLIGMTLFAPQGYIVLFFSLVLTLTLLFFDRSTRAARWYLFGATAALELLGTAPFGMATLTAALLLGSHFLFGERLRFTTTGIRYTLALLTVCASANILLFPLVGYWSRLPGILLAILIGAALGLTLNQSATSSPHELS